MYTIVTAMYGLDVKYNIATYPGIFSRWLRKIYQYAQVNGYRKPELIFFTDESSKKYFESVNSSININFIIKRLDDFPPVPKVASDCNLKLGGNMGGRFPKNGLNTLNKIWCNKLWLMEHARQKTDRTQLYWIDCGLKMAHKHLKLDTMYTPIKSGTLRVNSYIDDVSTKFKRDRPHRIKHLGCDIPHHVMGGIIGCNSQDIVQFNKLFKQVNNDISLTCKCYDEETILSTMYMKNNKMFMLM